MNQLAYKTKRFWLLLLLGLLAVLFAGLFVLQNTPADATAGIDTFIPLVLNNRVPTQNDEYVVIGWNDLGMHCYDLDYSVMAVLPP